MLMALESLFCHLLVASMSSMRLSMESNPSLTLVAVTLTSFAVTILSPALSRVSVRIAASERSSAIDAVVAL